MGFMVPIALFGWIPVVLLLFMLLPPRRAVLTAFLFAWLFLPMAGYRMPGILPDYTKMSATIMGVMLGALIFDTNRLLSFRLRIWDLPFLIFCICPFFSSMSNGLGWWDGISASRERFLGFGLVYYIGRIYFNDLAGLRELAVGLFIGGLVYMPLCLFEIRFSPQLHRLVYGYHAHSFAQTYRMGGWRPTVFMQHGLMVGMWMAMSTLMGIWLWMTGSLRHIYGISMVWLVPMMFVTTVLCRSLNSLVLMVMGLGALVAVKYVRTYVLVALLTAIPPVYAAVRATGVWSGDGLLNIVATYIDEDRAGSLQFRFMNEDLLADKALQRPVFGWGGWGRARVFNEKGEDITVTDGLWIIILGSNGIIGVSALILMLILPTIVLRLYHRADQWSHPLIAPAAGLAMISVLYMIDNLPNAMHNPIYLIVAGAGVGYGAATFGAPARRPMLAGVQAPQSRAGGYAAQPSHRAMPVRQVRPLQ